jgi:translation initiation factor IF-3
MPLADALSLAREGDVDLVEIDPNGSPPVCRLLDYGKWKYQQAKKERDARKRQHLAIVHEVRMRPRIGQHDMERKVRTVERLLSAGDKVKVSVRFRGREMSHPELGRELLGKVIEGLKGMATAERSPSMEGRRLSIIMAPTNKKPVPKPEATPEEETAVQA